MPKEKKRKRSPGPNPDRQLLEAYYDEFSGRFLIPDYGGGWVAINEGSLKTTLVSMGYETKPYANQLVSEIQQFVIDTQRGRNVKYAGPVAGYYPGEYDTPNGKFLVTVGPTVIDADPSVPWDTLRGIIERMLGEEQAQYLYGWLHFSRIALKSGNFFPGQVLAIAGKKDCGKSLLQNLITMMLGGRSAKPYQYMSGQTPFNAHLFGAEHLMIEDESPATDHKARRMMGSMIKQFSVNDEQSCHRKGATPFMLRPFWRVSITVNDEPENLMVLPILDESLEDKIMLLKAELHPMPCDTRNPINRKAFWNKLISELPGMIHFVETFAIPEHLQSQRMGITHFQNRELLMQLSSLSPEEKFRQIIDQYIVPGIIEWKGKAIDLEARLVDSDCPHHYEARKLLQFSNSCGTYLGRLRQRYPERFIHIKTNNGSERQWIIKPEPSAELFDEEDFA